MGQVVIELNPEISYENVGAELDRVLQKLAEKPPLLLIDCVRIKHCDSSISALFIEILRHARKARIEVNFDHIPRHVANILNLSNLNPLIPTP